MSDLWYRLDKGDYKLPKTLCANFRAVVSQSSWREDLYLRCLRLYSNVELLGLPGFSYQRFILPANRLRLNMVQAVVDTAVAIQSTTTNKVKMLTDGGRFSRRRKSERITKFLGGQFHYHNIFSEDQPIFQEAALLGHCGLMIDDEGEELTTERVPATEVWVDEIEARYGRPRTLYRYVDMGKDEVRARYDLDVADLANAGSILPKYQFRQQVDTPVGVLQAWRLPSYRGAKDGRCAVVLGDKIAPVHDEWTDMRFPIGFFEYSPRPLCWGGQGLAETLNDLQLELNWVLRKIQSLMNLNTAHIMVPETAQMKDEDFTNADLSLWRYHGNQAPTVHMAQSVAPEFFQQAMNLYRQGFELTGISQMQASARKEVGLASGEAIREANDLQSARFQAVQKAWADFHVDIGDRMIRAANRLNKKLKTTGKKGYAVPVEDRGYLEPIYWDDLEFDPDKDFYIGKRWPVNILPDTPQGKIDTLVSMGQAGLIDQSAAFAMLGRGHPDIEALVNREAAPRDLCQRLIEDIVDKGEKGYKEPLSIYPLQAFIKEFGQAHMEAELDGVPKERCDLLIRWIKQAHATMKIAQPPAPPPMPAAPGAVPPEAIPPGQPGVPTPQTMPPELAAALPEGVPNV